MRRGRDAGIREDDKMLKILKRNGSPVEEANKKIDEAEVKIDELEAEKATLIKKNENFVLAGKDAAPIKEKIQRVQDQITDIKTILLPKLQEEVKSAKAEEEKVRREKRIGEVRANEAELYDEIAEKMSIVSESRKRYQESLNRLVQIKEQHNDNLRELGELGGRRSPNQDWNILLNFLRPFGK